MQADPVVQLLHPSMQSLHAPDDAKVATGQVETQVLLYKLYPAMQVLQADGIPEHDWQEGLQATHTVPFTTYPVGQAS